MAVAMLEADIHALIFINTALRIHTQLLTTHIAPVLSVIIPTIYDKRKSQGLK